MSPLRMPPQTVLLCGEFYVEHHRYKSRGVLDQQEIVLEKGSVMTVCDCARWQAEGWMEGRVSSLCGKRTYEPRRLPFPAPEELYGVVRDLRIKVMFRNDLHANPSCNLCQACIIIRLVIRSLQSLLSVFHALPRNLIMTGR